MSASKKPSIFRSNTFWLIVINLVTVLVFASAFILVSSTFSRVSAIFDNQVSKNMNMAVASFGFGKTLLSLEGDLHNIEDNYLHDPEGMIVGRQMVLADLDETLHQIKSSANYFSSEEKNELLQHYRHSLANRLTDNVEISKITLRLDTLNQHFLATLDRMELEAGRLIVEKILNGFDATGLHQVNALLPLCREQILLARFLMEIAVTDLDSGLLVSHSAQRDNENLSSAVNRLLQTLETLTSANPLIADKANLIIGESAAYLEDVQILNELVQRKRTNHAESEKYRKSIIVTLGRVDREAAAALQAIGKRTGDEMTKAGRGLYLVAAIVLVVSIIGGVIAHLIGQQMGKDVAEKERARSDLAGKIEQLESEVALRRQTERAAQEIAENLEKMVQERTTDLASVNLELEAFVYSMSHDLRTPLRGIAGFSNVLLDDYGASLDESAKRYLSRIQESSIRMGRTIDEILKLSRLTQEKIVKEMVDLSGAAEMIIQELQNNHPERTVQVKIAPDLTVEAGGEQIRAVLECLIGNAWKFTGNKKPAKIEFGAVEKDAKTTFFMKDNGVGFNEAYSAKMFGAFQRLHAMEEFAGSGIGLALVQRVVQRHGGKVWAEGKEGEGATFYFSV